MKFTNHWMDVQNRRDSVLYGFLSCSPIDIPCRLALRNLGVLSYVRRIVRTTVLYPQKMKTSAFPQDENATATKRYLCPSTPSHFFDVDVTNSPHNGHWVCLWSLTLVLQFLLQLLLSVSKTIDITTSKTFENATTDCRWLTLIFQLAEQSNEKYCLFPNPRRPKDRTLTTQQKKDQTSSVYKLRT